MKFTSNNTKKEYELTSVQWNYDLFQFDFYVRSDDNSLILNYQEFCDMFNKKGVEKCYLKKK